MTDPFGTAGIRRRVLAGWAASPARFREDANAEEDFARTGYRDRLVVELAQNAADAAARAGVAGRLLLRLDTDALVAANTGAPLDAEGVQALSTLRASAKRDDDPAATVGRYGVGFAAVLAVTDDPVIASTTGQVGWHRDRTLREVGAVGSLAEELARRGGAVPVLRLPWSPAGGPVEPVPGFDTTVRLPLRDAAALALARRLLADVDAGLLLMLPALAEVTVQDRTGGAAGDGVRLLRARDLDVRQVERSGRLDAGLLADRPTEERRRTTWSVRWAVPRPPGVPAVVHAPTPTDEPLDLPGLLIASFPLDPSRRHVAGGPLRDFLVERAAEAWVSLVRDVAAADPGPAVVLGLVPGPVAAGALDAEVRQAVLAALAAAPVLAAGLRPDEALAVDGLGDAGYAVLADVVPGLLPPAWAGRRELDRLGVRRSRLADLVDDLAVLARPASWWRGLYEALSGADREALTGLPVPLTDGRLVRGPRSVVVGADEELAQALAGLGMRVADPDAAHPLLERLGAVPAQPRALLDDPAVHAAVAASMDADDPGQVGAAVLGLVRAAGVGVGELDWLGDLALPDETGEWVPAGELLLPGGVLDGLVATGALGRLDPGWAKRWGTGALTAVGVLDTFAVVRDGDVPVDPDRSDHDLDGEDRWLAEVAADLDERPAAESWARAGTPPLLPELVAVRDLDLVDDGQWPAALRLIAGDPRLRACVCEPQRVVGPDGSSVQVAPYTAWWLSTHPVLGGRLPGQLHAPGLGESLAGLLDPAPDLGLDRAFLAAIGVVTSLADVAASPMVLPLLRAGVDPVGAVVDGTGTAQPVPAVVSRVLTGAAASYLEHEDLRVGGVRCDWWVDDDHAVHACTGDGLARGLAWVADRWDLRLLLAAVLADPAGVDDVLAEESWA